MKRDLALETARDIVTNTICQCGHMDTEHVGGPPVQECGECDCPKFTPATFLVRRSGAPFPLTPEAERAIADAAVSAAGRVEGWCDRHDSWRIHADGMTTTASTKFRREFRHQLRLRGMRVRANGGN